MPGTKKDDDKIAPVDAPTKTPADPADKAGDDPTKKDDAADLGDFKSPAELKTAYDLLQTKFGEQGTKLGTARKEGTAASEKLAKMEADAKAAEPEPTTDFEAKSKEIREKIDDGRLTIAEGFEEHGNLVMIKTAAESARIADEKIKEVMLDEKATTAEAAWHKRFPDYQPFIDSGRAAEIIKEHPDIEMLLDPTMAYLFQRELDAGDKAVKAAAKTAKGTELTEKVLDEPGATPPRTPTRQTPVSEAELEEIQLGTIKKMRGEAV